MALAEARPSEAVCRNRGAGTIGGAAGEQMDALMEIQRAIDSSVTLRNKRDLILAFVDSVTITGDTRADWLAYVEQERSRELDQIIEEEALKPAEARSFVAAAFRDGAVATSGTAIAQILPPSSRFSRDSGHGEKKRRVIERLQEFFDRFHDIAGT